MQRIALPMMGGIISQRRCSHCSILLLHKPRIRFEGGDLSKRWVCLTLDMGITRQSYGSILR